MHPIAYTTNIALKIMEQIINNPAYTHITEKILLNLSFQDLLSCQLLNKNCNQIMEKPLFWLKKWISRGLLSTTSQKDWSKAMQLTKNNTDLKENIVSYLKRILKKPFFMDIPCYIDEEIFEFFNSLSLETNMNAICKEILQLAKWKCAKKVQMISVSIMKKLNGTKMLLPSNRLFGISKQIDQAAETGDVEILKVLAVLIDNPNTSFPTKPINIAAEKGHVEVIKFLSPLSINPNSPRAGLTETPIYNAARGGHAEVIKILAPFTANPNMPNKCGTTPIHVAALYGHLEVIKVMTPLVENLNVETYHTNETPIYLAAEYGHLEVVKYLAPLVSDPNRPNKYGKSPIAVAERHGYTQIVQILQYFSAL